MNKSTVLRRCVACRKLLDRQQLLRVIRDHQDGVVLTKGMGRSAYLCPCEDCLEEARRRKRLQKALRCQVPESVFEVLQKRLSQSIDEAAEAI
ncbi:YlxR family protein [Prochlorococcus sp. MIT 1341]|uniref:YlxR family protein n=1 Tax=Prochlorococcus sp. MIT 1341 TaxID=3096221 RepID=UPI002A7562B0|nr:YlxR family protein [Prochlorococcus sp. MIT 1341]